MNMTIDQKGILISVTTTLFDPFSIIRSPTVHVLSLPDTRKNKLGIMGKSHMKSGTHKCIVPGSAMQPLML